MGGFSIIGLKTRHSRWVLRSHGLQSCVIELQNGCKIHCWAPTLLISSASSRSSNCDAIRNAENGTSSDAIGSSSAPPSKPCLLFLHGFGGSGTIAWESQVAALSKEFWLFLPDLLFFGDSTVGDNNSNNIGDQSSTSKDGHIQKKTAAKYSEIFQAECMYEAMSKMGVQEAVVIGHSYGGFVAYRMAHFYPSFVKRLVIVSSGIMMDSHTNDGLLCEFGADRIHDMLVPPTLALFKKSLQFTFNGYFPPWLPSFFYKDMYENMSGDKQGRLQLVEDIILGKEGSPPLPLIEQSTLILWGEKDRIFNVNLAYKLKEFLGAKVELCTIEGASHVPQIVKPKEINKLLISFLKTSQ